jgi:copper chaperone CopZ
VSSFDHWCTHIGPRASTLRRSVVADGVIGATKRTAARSMAELTLEGMGCVSCIKAVVDQLQTLQTEPSSVLDAQVFFEDAMVKVWPVTSQFYTLSQLSQLSHSVPMSRSVPNWHSCCALSHPSQLSHSVPMSRSVPNRRSCRTPYTCRAPFPTGTVVAPFPNRHSCRTPFPTGFARPFWLRL